MFQQTGQKYLIIGTVPLISYAFEKAWRFDVDRAAPLRHQHRSIIALTLTYDLTVHKHRDQWTLREPPRIGLKDINMGKLTEFIITFSVLMARLGPFSLFHCGSHSFHAFSIKENYNHYCCLNRFIALVFYVSLGVF